MNHLYWGILLLILLVFELMTPGPTALWFGAGAIVGGCIAIAGGTVALQIIGFLVTSIVVAMLLRPTIQKWKETPPEKTNVDALIGKIVHVIETINNYEETGVAILEGKEWTARSVDEEVILAEGSMGIVKEISGVKLLLEPVNLEHNVEDRL